MAKTRFCITGDYGLRTGKYGWRTGKLRVTKKQVGRQITGCFGLCTGKYGVCTGFVRVKPGFRQATCFPASNFCTKLIKKLTGASNARSQIKVCWSWGEAGQAGASYRPPDEADSEALSSTKSRYGLHSEGMRRCLPPRRYAYTSLSQALWNNACKTSSSA